MQIVYDSPSLEHYFATAVRVSEERPVLVDRFLEDAFECDVDAISDGKRVVIGGIMQHIEDAGIHSGDSACVLPPYLIGESDMATMREQTVGTVQLLQEIGGLTGRVALALLVVRIARRRQLIPARRYSAANVSRSVPVGPQTMRC